MDTLMDRLNEAVFFIRQRTAFQPEYGIILGTGLGNLVKDIKVENEINYSLIPHFQGLSESVNVGVNVNN